MASEDLSAPNFDAIGEVMAQEFLLAMIQARQRDRLQAEGVIARALGASLDLPCGNLMTSVYQDNTDGKEMGGVCFFTTDQPLVFTKSPAYTLVQRKLHIVQRFAIPHIMLMRELLGELDELCGSGELSYLSADRTHIISPNPN